MSNPCLLNKRFEVIPDLNLVKDRDTKNQSRLEARLMQLLCMLMENEGQLVSRETITTQIWDNYGNADEGLTQAISYLRKILDDNEKKVIETIPKKGYVLHGVIEVLDLEANAKPTIVGPAPKNRNEKRYVVMALFMCIVVAVVFVIFKPFGAKPSQSPDLRPGGADAPASNERNEQPGRGADVYYEDSNAVRIRDSMIP